MPCPHIALNDNTFFKVTPQFCKLGMKPLPAERFPEKGKSHEERLHLEWATDHGRKKRGFRALFLYRISKFMYASDFPED
jgi:hypothetical protein